MAEPTKLTVKTEKPSTPSLQTRHPFENLRREIDRLFDDGENIGKVFPIEFA